MSGPPKRWGAEAPEPFRYAKRAYRADGPSEEQLARMLARVETAAVLPTEGGSSFPSAGHKSWTWLVSAFGAVAIGVVGVALRTSVPAPSRPLSSETFATEPVVRRSALTYLPLAVANDQRPTAPGERRPRAALLPERPRVPSDLVSELSLLEGARRVIAHRPARALDLTNLHRQRFHRGQFEQERELLAIEALLTLGRVRAARARAARFARKHGDSVHMPRLEQLLLLVRSD